MSETEKLLGKCCAKCGFLYCIVSDPLGGHLRIIDPDAIRRNRGERIDDDVRNEPITLRPYQLAGLPRQITWSHVETVCCHQEVFSPIYTHTKKAQPDTSVVINVAYPTITQDRAACLGYFPYHPGFSAKEHAEIHLQEERDAQQKAFQDRWNTLIFEAEENARKREERRDQLEAEHRKFNILLTSANFILAVILGALVVTEFLIKFIFPVK